MKFTISFFILLCSNLAFGQSNNYLADKFWRLEFAYINGKGYEYREDNLKSPTMSFNSTRMRGNSGCNAYKSKYYLMGETIQFSNVTSTKMDCNSKIEEVVYYEAIEGLHKIYIDESSNKFTIESSNGNILRFKLVSVKAKR